MKRKKIEIFVIIVGIFFAILLTGCGGATTSSTPIHEEETVEKETERLDIKMVHRLAQRGYDLQSEEIEKIVEGTPVASEANNAQVQEADRMTATGQWVPVELIIDAQVKEIFNEQTLHYFAEDVYENFPPVRLNTIDAIATMLYEQDSHFILDGVIRNGFVNQSFTKEQIETLWLRLVTATNHTWASTRMEGLQGFETIHSREAVPFRLFIKKENVSYPEFDYGRYSYYAVIEQPDISENTTNEQ